MFANAKTREWKAEVATYRPKEEKKDVTVEDFKVTKIELGTMDRAGKNHLFKETAQQMLITSVQDRKEKKELKKTTVSLS